MKMKLNERADILSLVALLAWLALGVVSLVLDI